MKTWIYSWIVYPSLYAVATLVALAKPKIRETLRLRSWKDFLSLRFNAGQPIEYWVHVASHGELEYAIPLLEELERRQKRVLVTYYSISAKGPVEQLHLTFKNVSLVVPLPHDGLGLMREFVALVKKQGVSCLLLMKYELWPGLLWECNAQGIKVILANALRPSWFHRRLLHKLDGIFSGYAFEVDAIQHRYVHVSGDTRVERVLRRMDSGERKLDSVITPKLRGVLRARPVLVGGSLWPPDTRLVAAGLRTLASRGVKLSHLIWVPHELDRLEARAASETFEALGYRVIELGSREEEEMQASVEGLPIAVIVMKKGILAELYQLGQCAFVGGGFGSGVHSVWEPAIAGAAVACGPRTKRSPESFELKSRGLLEEIADEAEMAAWLERCLCARRLQIGAISPIQDVVSRHIGASKRILELCDET